MEMLWLVTLLAGVCDSARILVLQPTSAKGHAIAMAPLFEELAARGHQVTLFTAFPHNPPIPNLREIDVSHKLAPIVSNFSLEKIKEAMPNPFSAPTFMTEIEQPMCEAVFSDSVMQKLLDSKSTFDLVMTEIFTADCYAVFAHKFNAPLVSFVTSVTLPWAADRVGLPDNPSYIPNYFLDFTSHMNLYQRIYNTILYIYSKMIHSYYSLPKTRDLVKKYYGDSVPPVETILKNTSLLLVNSHFSLSESRPFPPNVVEVGGIHIRNSVKALPKDLQDILDRSSQGVVLVSFGSMVRVASFPQHIIQAFLKVFSTLPQTIIMKYEDDLPDAPPNVVTRKWLPQREVMEHKNVKALVAHGGLSSTVEAVYFGKPLVGIPFFCDQHLNIETMVGRGAAVKLDLQELSEQNVAAALHQVLSDPTFTENAKRLSHQFRDRPLTALQTAVYWIEYVIRHQGAPHLRPASVSLSLYQYLLLDVAAVLLLPLLPLFYIIYFLFFRAVEVSPNDYRNYITKKDE